MAAPRKGDPCPRCAWPIDWIVALNETAHLGCPNCNWPGIDTRNDHEPAPEPEPERPSPDELFNRAKGNQGKYAALMIEYGYVIPDQGDDE